MFSDKAIIRRLVKIIQAKGIFQIVTSPGSRNAPIIQTFYGVGDMEMYSIPDERVAGFFALGLAMKSKMPVVLLCTSGSAVVNYGPAVVEAYYQNIPLIVISADRPAYYIDQGHGQSMRQDGVFNNYIRGSLTLTESMQSQPWFVDSKINEIIEKAHGETLGPVHINVPLDEPLYQFQSEMEEEVRLIEYPKRLKVLDKAGLSRLTEIWNRSNRVMILVGQMSPTDEFNRLLSQFSKDKNVVVLCEHTSNLFDYNQFIHQIDRAIYSLSDEQWLDYHPDLLITFGKEIVSKKIKKILLRTRVEEHWHFGSKLEQRDTFGSLTQIIDATVHTLWDYSDKFDPVDSSYYERWQKRKTTVAVQHNEFVQKINWSDLKVWSYLMNALPDNSHIHLGNSASIRYSLLFDSKPNQLFYSNRGVSGIDGCTSTAVGFSQAADSEPVFLITGDISFMYDSNAFWHTPRPKNLKIVVVNNNGGGIFRFIPGPQKTDVLDKFLETSHENSVLPLVKSFGIKTFQARSNDDLQEIFQNFVLCPSLAVLEINTPRKENDKILKEYFNNLSKT
ncbi:2-succinyl-5-enolpyruvyl-6-hydroxy-3-cyclohexene-1-carboxylic-acid synthase [Membranihabitans marinus]|uniref:2-succinyl-5-enolpyruvyl-6-hydroxy-3- cyclohexene-1-carboxylic-acid synthase n=1 Tax=Membranihabitans marinus TaxID=1227546 RepID=UPI001F02BBEB|nr:2-succinyl-5-enolpyruvyl-6-hydroxy-3-cyclohexene-1-carboxylic-acid synthase [Membranihabitans marinus]